MTGVVSLLLVMMMVVQRATATPTEVIWLNRNTDPRDELWCYNSMSIFLKNSSVQSSLSPTISNDLLIFSYTFSKVNPRFDIK